MQSLSMGCVPASVRPSSQSSAGGREQPGARLAQVGWATGSSLWQCVGFAVPQHIATLAGVVPRRTGRTSPVLVARRSASKSSDSRVGHPCDACGGGSKISEAPFFLLAYCLGWKVCETKIRGNSRGGNAREQKSTACPCWRVVRAELYSCSVDVRTTRIVCVGNVLQ